MTGSSRQLLILWSAQGTEARQDYGLLYLTEFWAVILPALHVALPFKFCLKNLQAHVVCAHKRIADSVGVRNISRNAKSVSLVLFLLIVDRNLVCIDFTSKNVHLSASY